MIPALNEAETIESVVTAAAAYARVIVVDDGSTDETAFLARRAGAEVVSPENREGYDAALDAGFRKAQQLGCAAVITMDADGEHDPRHIDEFAASLAESDTPLVLGVRPDRARWSEWLLGIVMARTFGVTDIFCGMKGYRLDLFRENDGFDHVGSIGTELALNSIRRGHRFAEVRIIGQTREDGVSRFGGSVAANWKLIKALFRANVYGYRHAGRRAGRYAA